MSESERDKLADSISPKEFIEGFRKGDPRVVHLLYERYFVRLCDYCYHFLGNSFDAEDIVSATFEKLLTVYRKKRRVGKSFNGIEDIESYLYTAARNRCFNMLQQKKKQRQIRLKLSENAYCTEDLLDLEYHRGLADLTLLKTIYKLDQRSIQVLRKIYFEDMSYEEIAIDMKISRATVSNLRQQGINILAKQLPRLDVISLVWSPAMLLFLAIS